MTLVGCLCLVRANTLSYKTRSREAVVQSPKVIRDTMLATGRQASKGGNSPLLIQQARIGRLKKHPNSAGERGIGLYRCSLHTASLNPGFEQFRVGATLNNRQTWCLLPGARPYQMASSLFSQRIQWREEGSRNAWCAQDHFSFTELRPALRHHTFVLFTFVVESATGILRHTLSPPS